VADVKALRTEYDQILVQVRDLNEQHKAGMPAEKAAACDTMLGRLAEIKAEIETERKADDRRKSIEEHTAFNEKAVYLVPRTGPVTPDAEGVKTLVARGWERKNGWLYAPIPRGEPVQMYPETLFTDPSDGDPHQQLYVKQAIAALQPIYFKAYSRYLSLAARFHDPGIAMTMMTAEEQKALSEGSDAAGGFLVPPDLQAQILNRTAQVAVVRRRATVRNTTRDVLQWTAIAPHGTSGSIYSSNFVGGWVGEASAFSDTDPVFQLFPIMIKKVRVGTKLSNDLIADSVANVLASLSEDGARNMALVEDSGFIAGDGAALQPVGILNAGVATVDVEGSTADTISNAAGAGSSAKLVTLAYTLPAQYASGASWLMRRSIEGKVRNLNDSGGRPLWPAYSGSGFAPAPTDLIGSPVDNSDFMPADGTNANKVIVYGDFSNYIIAQRAQISTVILRERFADTEQVGILLIERVGGAAWNVDAFRVGVV
jgi:HK97 family phage major capsid protein